MKRTVKTNDNNKPLMSVMLHNNNDEKYIEQCFDSILNQTYDNIEIIFYDCGSNDNSWDIAVRYQISNPGIITLLHLRKNISVDGVINHLQNLRGKYFMRMRTCNALRPQLVEKAIEAMENNPEAAFVMFNTIICDEFGNEFQKTPIYNESCVVPGLEHIWNHLLINPPVNDPLCIYNTDMLKLNAVKEPYLSELYLCLKYDMIYFREAHYLFREYTPSLLPGEAKGLTEMFRRFLYKANFIKYCSMVYEMPEAVDKLSVTLKLLSELSLQQSVIALINTDKNGAKKYLYLSAAIDLNIENNEAFKKVNEYLRDEKIFNPRIVEELNILIRLINKEQTFPLPKGSKLL